MTSFADSIYLCYGDDIFRTLERICRVTNLIKSPCPDPTKYSIDAPQFSCFRKATFKFNLPSIIFLWTFPPNPQIFCFALENRNFGDSWGFSDSLVSRTPSPAFSAVSGDPSPDFSAVSGDPSPAFSTSSGQGFSKIRIGISGFGWFSPWSNWTEESFLVSPRPGPITRDP